MVTTGTTNDDQEVVAAEDQSGSSSPLSAMQKLVIEGLNSGYLKNLRSLREALMVSEWDNNLKCWAQRR